VPLYLRVASSHLLRDCGRRTARVLAHVRPARLRLLHDRRTRGAGLVADRGGYRFWLL